MSFRLEVIHPAGSALSITTRDYRRLSHQNAIPEDDMLGSQGTA